MRWFTLGVMAMMLLAISCSPTHAPPPAPSGPPGSAASTPPTDVSAPMLVTPEKRSGDSERVTLRGGARLQVYDNRSLSGSADVTRAVLVVHGTGRNAEGYFDRALSAATAAGVADRTVIVAPHFKTDDDDPHSRDVRWSEDGWKEGDGADKPDGLSSFEVMDNLVATLSDRRRFPQLTEITITGHSAGGQFVQRYAAFGKAPNLLPWMKFNFVVMNPSSFVYFGPERPNAGGSGYAPGGCPGYDDYKYGLGERTGYVGELTPRQVLAQYLARTVTVANGADDTVDNGDLDTSCQADAQGPSRSARGRYFYNHYPARGHDYVLVPDVAHDSDAMFASPLLWPALFGVSGS